MKCKICQREVPDGFVEKHHLVPKSRDKNKNRGLKTIKVCVDCGDQLHLLFTNKELRKQYNTVEAILANEQVRKWTDWVKSKKRFGMCMAKKKRK